MFFPPICHRGGNIKFALTIKGFPVFHLVLFTTRPLSTEMFPTRIISATAHFWSSIVANTVQKLLKKVNELALFDIFVVFLIHFIDKKSGFDTKQSMLGA